MLTKYNGSAEHIELLRTFKERLGYKDSNGVFNNPFSYYSSRSEANVSLWLLIMKSEVIATVITKRQKYNVSGCEEDVYFLKYPVSLSIVDKNYTMAAAWLAASIKKKFKYSFLLGMGGSDSKAAKFFESARFVNIDIPFYIKVISWTSIILHNPITSKILRVDNSYPNSKVNEVRIDKKILKQVEKLSYKTSFLKDTSFGLLRTTDIVNFQAPQSISAFVKLHIIANEKIVGRILLFETSPRYHRLFGRLNLWTILDFEFDSSKIASATVNKLIKRHALKRKIDVLLFNTGLKRHKQFCNSTYWLKIKSNFCLSVCPALADRINYEDLHITRLDGDGPINLGANL